MQSYIVHFIRHGLTEANINGKFAGSGDFSLCSRGVEGLRKLMEKYKYPYSQEYYTSPMKRCVETAKILYPEAKVEVIDGLRECVFNDEDNQNKNVETWDEIQKRVTKTFDNIVESMMKRKVTSATICTHGGVIMTLLYCYGIPRAEFLDWMVNNGCGYSVRITPGLWMREKMFEVYDKIPQGADVTLNNELKELLNKLQK